ncbi:MAG: hypothetical protein JRJ02_13130 [Deltaproteobacteria bacterium]|nr:hypothetical protein [Deltaproteobacteria bacterium]MBW1863295.1 hypothetical protein [Deltaproteobacteria bacterium]
MPEPTSDKHYEEEFEFTLWKMIQQRAKEKDISYRKAADEVVSEYKKTIRYRDVEFETKLIQNRIKEMAELRELEQSGKTV